METHATRLVWFRNMWCEALSSNFLPGGGLRAKSGGPPVTVFFTFDTIFVASNTPPETKVE